MWVSVSVLVVEASCRAVQLPDKTGIDYTKVVLQVQMRLSLGTQAGQKGMGPTLMKLATAFAPSAISVLHKFRLLQCAAHAVMDGVCVFLLTCMLLSPIHM